METSSNFDKCGQPASHANLARISPKDARKQPKRCALPSAVGADDSNGLAAGHFEIDIAKRPEISRSIATSLAPKKPTEGICDKIAQRIMRLT